MARTTPCIKNDTITYSDGTQVHTFLVGSEAWWIWLCNDLSIFRFESPTGHFTARCDSNRNGRYWYAYRTCNKKLHKVYIGKSEELTLARLEAIAQELLRRSTSSNNSTQFTSKNLSASHIRNIQTQLPSHRAEKDDTTESSITNKTPVQQENSEAATYQLAEVLTEREVEVIRYLAAGLSNKEIAQRMVVSESTIKWHLKNIYSKLQVHRRSQVVAQAVTLL